MKEVNFTTTEWKIIEHRLGAPDAVAEVLSEGNAYDGIIDRVYELQTQGASCIDWKSKIDLDIIQDCCNGCTLFVDIQDAVLHGEISKGEMMQLFKAAKSIEKQGTREQDENNKSTR